MKVAPVAAPDHLKEAVAELAKASGIQFQISDNVVTGTELHVVYATEHPLPDRYTAESATFGFRVPRNFPDAGPEDSFFLEGTGLTLKVADPKRNSTDIHRASGTVEILRGTELDGRTALVFSWHVWEKSAWNRRKHTLIDHYNHCIRRFEEAEHDG